jgi:hypothetical protein
MPLHDLLMRADLTVAMVQEAATLPREYWLTHTADMNVTPVMSLTYNYSMRADKAQFAEMLQAVASAPELKECCTRVWAATVGKADGARNGPLANICVHRLVSPLAVQTAIDAGDVPRTGDLAKQRLWDNSEFCAQDMREFCGWHTADELEGYWLDEETGTPLRWVYEGDRHWESADGDDEKAKMMEKYDHKFDLAAEQTIRAGLLTCRGSCFDRDLRLLFGYFRKKSPCRFTELCSLKELWDGSSRGGLNPLTCAIERGDREAVRELAKSLASEQAVGRVRDILDILRKLFESGDSELERLAREELLQRGGIQVLDPKRFMAPFAKDKSGKLLQMSLDLAGKTYAQARSSGKLEPFACARDRVEYDKGRDELRLVSPYDSSHRVIDKSWLHRKPMQVETGQYRKKQGVYIGVCSNETKQICLKLRNDDGDWDVVIGGQEKDRVVLVEPSCFWQDLLRKGNAERKSKEESSKSTGKWAQPVEPVAVAINRAFKPGRGGLLYVLHRFGTEAAYSSEAVQLLVDWKWDTFGKSKFLYDTLFHITLVTAWTILTLRIAWYPQTLFIHLPTKYAVLAGFLCVSTGTWLRYFDQYFWMLPHSVESVKSASDEAPTTQDTQATSHESYRGTQCTSRALECNPVDHDSWNSATPRRSALRKINRVLYSEDDASASKDRTLCSWTKGGWRHQLWWFAVLPLHYVFSASIRFLPAVVAFIMLGGVCHIPPLSYSECSSNWNVTLPFFPPWLEALAMTVLLSICGRNAGKCLVRFLCDATAFLKGTMPSVCNQTPEGDAWTTEESVLKEPSPETLTHCVAWLWRLTLWDIVDAVSLPLVVLTAFQILGDTDRASVTQVAGVTTLLLWFRMIHYLSGMHFTSKYVEIFIEMISAIVVFMLFLVLFIVGNALSLQLFYPNAPDETDVGEVREDTDLGEWWRGQTAADRADVSENFGSLGSSLFTSYSIMLQAFDTTLFRLAYRPRIVKLCVLVYATLSHVAMLNMLIASMSAKYAEIDRDPRKLQYRQRAALILAYELLDDTLGVAKEADTSTKTAGASGEDEGPEFMHFFTKPDIWKQCTYFIFFGLISVINYYIAPPGIGMNALVSRRVCNMTDIATKTARR